MRTFSPLFNLCTFSAEVVEYIDKKETRIDYIENLFFSEVIKGIDSVMKVRGYKEFVENLGLTQTVLRIEDGNDLNTINLGKDAVLSALESDNKPDAVLCCNDWMAVGALNAAKQVGVLVPQELRIIGFDNTVISQITEPKLSTVDQQMSKLGVLAAKRLYTLMSTEDNENQKIYLETKLVIRDS